MRTFQFTKWFFDFQLNASEYVVVFISEVRLFSLKLFWFQLQGNLKPENQGSARAVGYFRRIHPLGSDTGRWNFKEGFFEIEGQTCRMKFGFPGMSISFSGSYPEVDYSGDQMVYQRDRESSIKWHPLFLNADISGFLDQDGRLREFSSVPGYADQVVSNLWPWKLPVRKLFWGRWISGEKALSFSILLDRQDSVLVSRIFYYDGSRVYQADVTDLQVSGYQADAELECNYPERYAITGTGNCIRITLTISNHRKLIVSDFMTNVRVPHGLLRWMTKSPGGIKCSASADLEIRTDVETLKLMDISLIDEFVVF